MTAKRFIKFNITANDDYTIQNGVKDSVTGEWYHTIDNENAKRLCGLLNNLHEENKEFKEELPIYRKIASCSNCKYQNYDWFDDGDEFEICERGNNEQQIEYHICKDWRELS